MDWTTIISIVGIIGTWVAILLVYFTLREMRNQRIASQKPDLIIPKASVYGYVYGFEGMTGLLIPRNWSDNPDCKDLEHFISTLDLIKLYNVGFGVAKNIQLKWIIGYDKTLQQIKDYCYQNSVRIIVQQDKDAFSILEADYPPDESYSFSPDVYGHEFLMPASITSDGLSSSIPLGLQELISVITFLKGVYGTEHRNEGLERGDISELKIDFPSIRLELRYDDLENGHYVKMFDVTFFLISYIYYSKNEKILGLSHSLSGTFEFKSLPK